jgi:hypothetical protein
MVPPAAGFGNLIMGFRTAVDPVHGDDLPDVGERELVRRDDLRNTQAVDKHSASMVCVSKTSTPALSTAPDAPIVSAFVGGESVTG